MQSISNGRRLRQDASDAAGKKVYKKAFAAYKGAKGGKAAKTKAARASAGLK